MRSFLPALFALLFTSASFAVNHPSFLTPKTFSVGKYGVANPVSEVAADFNGDGKIDLAVVNQGTGFLHIRGYVAVLLGNGDGTFRPGVQYFAGGVPQSIAIGDFNSDGKVDLAVGNSSSSNISILLGNGDGSFQTHMDFGSVNSPQSIAVGDFNNDGKLDVACTDANTTALTRGNVSVLLGNGDGTLQTPLTSPAGGYIQAIAAGDFNGDGILDIAVANKKLSSFQGNLSVLLGKGDGTFQSPVKYLPSDSVYFVVVGDFNGDGHLDIALSDGGTTVLPGNGDGTFGAPIFSPGDFCPMAVGDFNGDGKIDLAFASYTDIFLVYGAGDGSFQSGPTYYAGGSSPSFVAVADFDGDHRPDLAVTNKVDSNIGVLLARARPAGELRSVPVYPNAIGSLAFADFNGDKRLDMASLSSTGSDYQVDVFSGNGDGTFGTPAIYTFTQTPLWVVSRDFNRDGKPDLAVGVSDLNCQNPGVAVLLGTGTGSFGTPVTYTAGACSQFIVSADMNHDGKLDLVTLGSVLLGNGDGTFQAPLVYSPGAVSPKFVAVGDLNGDGNPDLAVTFSSSTYAVLLGNGNGTFQNALTYALGNQIFGISMGDLNADGKLDLALATFSNSSGLGFASILLGNGDGTFQNAADYGLGVEFSYDIAIADLNRDGIPDVAAVGYSSTTDPTGSAVIFPGNGDGTLGGSVTISIGLPYEVTTADLNGDQVPDLIVIAEGATVFLNTTK
jgi:hypothetical protein